MRRGGERKPPSPRRTARKKSPGNVPNQGSSGRIRTATSSRIRPRGGVGGNEPRQMRRFLEESHVLTVRLSLLAPWVSRCLGLAGNSAVRGKGRLTDR